MTKLHIGDPSQSEVEKYAALWSDVPEYRNWSPGLANVERFISIMQPQPGESLIDIGCGEGKAGLKFREHGLDVWWLDITDAALDPSIPRERFTCAPAWSQWQVPRKAMRTPMIVPEDAKFSYGLSCDMIEHLPTEYTMLAVDRMLRVCRKLWLQVGIKEETFGHAIGHELHLTVRPFTWWRDRIASLGTLLEARDLCDKALFIAQR